MAIEVTQNKEVAKKRKGKRVSFAICRRRAHSGNINIKKRAKKSCLVKYWLLHSQSKGQAKREREEKESSEKDRSSPKKMITPRLACGSSGEKMPDREWERSDRRAEYPEIRRKDNELWMDSWIQTKSYIVIYRAIYPLSVSLFTFVFSKWQWFDSE